MSERKQKTLTELKQKLIFKGFYTKTIKSYIYNSEKFIGHSNLETTKIYTKLANIDLLKIKYSLDNL